MKKKEVILITGCAGFIGYNLAVKFLRKKYNIVGIDNLNSYYDVDLKRKRLSLLKKKFKNFIFFRADICSKKKLHKIFQKKKTFCCYSFSCTSRR